MASLNALIVNLGVLGYSEDHGKLWIILVVCLMTLGMVCISTIRQMAEESLRKSLEARKDETNANPRHWFEVATPDDLRRKIHAGVTILKMEAGNTFWTQSQRDEFEKAAKYVEAAEDLVVRATRGS